MTTRVTPRILIVDDEPGIRESLRMVLKNEYQCDVAANAKEALESFQESPPDLVLLDILMPDMDGITLLENAGQDLFHDKFTAEGINFGGALDPVIISAMLKNNNVDVTQANIDAIRAHYHNGLESTAAQRPVARALPGAHDLVNATLESDAIDALGLRTGNYPETGTIKIKRRTIR